MHLGKALSTFFLLFSALSLAVPTEPWTPSTRNLDIREVGTRRVLNRDSIDLKDRAVLPAIASIISIATTIYDVIKDLFEDDAEKAGEWVQRTLKQLAASNPSYNILIFHNQKSEYSLVNAVHYHYELPVSLGRTRGFEIWVFETGWFRLAGDGGYQNWGFSGCWEADGSYVEFCEK